MNLIYSNQPRKGGHYMSRTKTNFSSKFKSDLVLEVLKGEKDESVTINWTDFLRAYTMNLYKERLTIKSQV